MIEIEKTSGGQSHTSPFVGPTNHPLSVLADISELTTKEVDVNGYLKPGVPFKKDGTLCDGTAGEFVFGVTIEATKIVAANPTNATLAADTRTVPVTVAVICVVNRDIAEDVLERAYTASEIAAFDAAGSKCVLSRT